ncbi:Hypothetical_protein [Hexamita inflata]|uniref:Hypothetical_protein n=1 Tax=Hexamita inflata TaxID=28002 RepID=A0AA86R3Z7_9EUKA|nr:Hypothetical protein HINF_LOCUS53348 [Hexamita inflata]
MSPKSWVQIWTYAKKSFVGQKRYKTFGLNRNSHQISLMKHQMNFIADSVNWSGAIHKCNVKKPIDQYLKRNLALSSVAGVFVNKPTYKDSLSTPNDLSHPSAVNCAAFLQ